MHFIQLLFLIKNSFIWNMLHADITVQDLVVKYQLCVTRVGIRLLVLSC